MAWLQSKPSLKELCDKFPEEWKKVEQNLAIAFSSGKPSDVQAYLQRLAQPLSIHEKTTIKTQENTNIRRKTVSDTACFHMAQKAVQQHYVAIASGIDNGKVRFNLFNGLVAQFLLFEKDLVRKPASVFWFRLFWPLVWQKRFLMPLVQPKGIYCFYTGDLIKELAKLIGGVRCLEIAAGDGTLSRFLMRAGVNCTATDDCSWHHAITYPKSVIKLNAREALRTYNPVSVICSWPPAGNEFEKQIFVTKNVQQYIMIGSRHTFAAGNWEIYQSQTAFSMVEVPRLSSLVLPPELDPAVYVFTRKQS